MVDRLLELHLHLRPSPKRSLRQRPLQVRAVVPRRQHALGVTHAIYVLFPSSSHLQKQYPVSFLLKRGTWAPQVVLAGHAGIVGTCRYAPRLLQTDKGELLQLVGIGCDVHLAGKDDA